MAAKIDLKELAARESEQVEWKENVSDEASVVKTIAAFANDWANLGGGYVVCGAKEHKDEHGFPAVSLVGLTANRTREIEGKVLQGCREHVDPPLAPQVVELPAEDSDRRILVFVVPATHYAHMVGRGRDSGKYYVRIGSETREARNGILRELLVRKGALEPWDRRPCERAALSDLDLVSLRDALARLGAFDPARGIEHYLSPDVEIHALVPSLCTREPLTGEARPRNFAVLLFGRNVQRFIPGAFALFSCYPGLDRSEPHAERHEVLGSLLDQAKRLIELLDVQSSTAFLKTDPTEPNALKYPKRALHEATINALVHRDYEAVDPTRITVFSDRIEILSSGGLPTGVDPGLFVAGKASPKWRNQCLAWFMNRLQLAQAEGQGIPTILRVMREEGCPSPRFEVQEQRVLCVLPAHPRHALVRDYQAIEQLLALGSLEAAREKVHALLEADPLNLRAILLFAEVQSALKQPAAVREFVQRTDPRLTRLPPLALSHLAEALLSERDSSGEARLLASQMLAQAARGRFEERDARRVAVGLLKVQDDRGALEFLERSMREQPAWQTNAAFLQLRGRTLLQFAKRCATTLKDRQLPERTRRRAREECRSYLDRSEHDLREALTHAPEATIRTLAESDLEFIERLRRRQ